MNMRSKRKEVKHVSDFVVVVIVIAYAALC